MNNFPNSLVVGPFEVTVYYGETDNKPVVQVDGSGDLRVNVNDAPVFDQDTEAGGRDADGNVRPTVEDVALALRGAGVDAFAVLARMLAAAGSQPEWDSETIEHVLVEALPASNAAGLSWVGSTGVDDEGLEFWSAVAGVDVVPDAVYPWTPLS